MAAYLTKIVLLISSIIGASFTIASMMWFVKEMLPYFAFDIAGVFALVFLTAGLGAGTILVHCFLSFIEDLMYKKCEDD